jgi:hypothetical protein
MYNQRNGQEEVDSEATLLIWSPFQDGDFEAKKLHM